MAVKINLSKTRAFDLGPGAVLPLTFGQPRASEAPSAGASAVVTSISAQEGEVWEITPDVDIWAAFAASPDPTAVAARRFLAAGIPRNFAAASVGEKVGILAA